ncbi:MAG TPA: M23 family metallopeptidase [Quisquiliibacterium sp.]|nr:M23 family metallopeptidase [Quisquiliibacterium sp.]
MAGIDRMRGRGAWRFGSIGRTGAPISRAAALAARVALWLAASAFAAPAAIASGAAGASALGAAAASPSGAAAASDAPLRFGLPIRCTPGEDCFVQNYFDRDPGSGRRDFACGHLSYDAHKGTDFRVRSLAHMTRGVEVVAAAPGVVQRTRDGEPDISLRERGSENLRGREAGNGVLIDHGGGWQTQYSHLMRGSVRVRPGQRVAAGEVLGLVGLSGKTEFPHVDFVIRKDGQPLDPYAPSTAPALDAPPGCARGPLADTLWRAELVERLRYRATDVLIAGFAPEAADRGKAQRGQYDDATLDARAPSLVFFVEMFGARRGDREHIEILGPGDRPIVRREREVDADLAVRFGYVGRKLRGERWPPGEYVGRFRLERDGDVVSEVERRVSVR